jgi:hypothetical protein
MRTTQLVDDSDPSVIHTGAWKKGGRKEEGRKDIVYYIHGIVHE